MKRAFVKDEKTATEPYFIYVETPSGTGHGQGMRFNRRATADRVAAAINRAFEVERPRPEADTITIKVEGDVKITLVDEDFPDRGAWVGRPPGEPEHSDGGWR